MLVALDELDRGTAVAAVRALEVELFGNHAWSENAVRQELDAPARVYVFDCEREQGDGEYGDGGDGHVPGPDGCVPGVVRGFAGYWYDGEDAEIMDIGVGRRYQRRGLAARMLTWLIGHAREQGARRMLLEVAVNNEPAIALYRRFGFERIGLRRRYYQPEGIDAYVMALELKPRVVGFTGATSHEASEADTTNTTTDGTNMNGETEKTR
ncbi:GNAT family N-acetyltransferase [Bifidobacterium stellenboschense]|uniref:Ribosomal-protein-alanine N-acetyltransferase n=1 Tax=Bifidobacterium stellenboschense TaxID=762211 RepID=A0A087DPQ7_9BIFI|nr:GNAT family N-acetyltransferase [Bifidobacterium stellenboschense]KFI97507.1 ribosomal-protein-alanine N-acetyltransferase [Bifidobacterium stellenboschense]